MLTDQHLLSAPVVDDHGQRAAFDLGSWCVFSVTEDDETQYVPMFFHSIQTLKSDNTY